MTRIKLFFAALAVTAIVAVVPAANAAPVVHVAGVGSSDALPTSVTPSPHRRSDAPKGSAEFLRSSSGASMPVLDARRPRRARTFPEACSVQGRAEPNEAFPESSRTYSSRAGGILRQRGDG